MMRREYIMCSLLLLGSLAGCRGMDHDQPPIHPNLNMDFQERFDPQERNPFFADNRSNRPLVAGTIARGFLREDVPFYEGRAADGAFVAEYPVRITREILDRGQERYNIYCSPCHGMAGDGTGIITTGGYGYTPAPTYHTERIRAMPVGELYAVIREGIRTMPSYAAQVSVVDRWAIVAYIQALQRSQNAREGDVSEEILTEFETRAAAAPPPGGPEAGEVPGDTNQTEPSAEPVGADTVAAAQ